MLWMRSRVALLTLVALSGMSSFARAGDCCEPCCPPPVCVKKVCVTEWVPQHYEACRTVYKTEWKEEAYTTYKTECTPEVRTRSFTVNHMVTECRDEVRTVTKMVPTVEDRTITKNVYTTHQVTEMQCKTVDKGHYECRIEERAPTFFEKCHDKNKCCKPCYTTEKKVWVPCCVTVECPVTKCVKVCTPVTECIKVTVCKPVCVQETFKVNYTKCVPEVKTETYTVLVPHQVAVPCTRKVAICVPVVEKYTACKMVPVTVEKEVCEPCCEPKKKHHLFGG
jgi:hypothetical protein